LQNNFNSVSFKTLRKHKETDRQKNGEIETLTITLRIKFPV